jgi:hypothetical protein
MTKEEHHKAVNTILAKIRAKRAKVRAAMKKQRELQDSCKTERDIV